MRLVCTIDYAAFMPRIAATQTRALAITRSEL
jgi:hypothetical protein